MTKSVHVIGNDTDTVNMFASEGWSVVVEDPDLVCFTGGADVSPELYLEGYEGTRGTNPLRDLSEVGWYLHYQRQGTSMVGICRGGQFLNVMCGGSMIQHLRNPHYGRKAKVFLCTAEGKFSQELALHEDHHQGMIPAPHGKVLGIDVNDKNVEIILYKQEGIKDIEEYPGILCFQPHPEWGHEPTKELFFQYIEEYLCP